RSDRQCADRLLPRVVAGPDGAQCGRDGKRCQPGRDTDAEAAERRLLYGVAPAAGQRGITGSTTYVGCAASCSTRWCAATEVESVSLLPPVLRFRSYFGKSADEIVTRSWWPAGNTLLVNQRSRSYFSGCPFTSGTSRSIPFRKRARAKPSCTRSACPSGKTS